MVRRSKKALQMKFPEDVVKAVLKARVTNSQLAKLLAGTPLAKKVTGSVHIADLTEMDVEQTRDHYVSVKHWELTVPREKAEDYLVAHQERLKSLRKYLEKEVEDREKAKQVETLIDKYAQPLSQKELQQQKKEFGFVLTRHRQISWGDLVDKYGLENLEESKDKLLFKAFIDGAETMVALRTINIKNRKPIRVLVYGRSDSMPIYYKLKGEKYED